MPKKSDRLDFHHGAYAALKVHFGLMGAQLEYIQEKELGEKPIRIDFIIIKKSPEIQLEDPVGKFFKLVNIFEYKSPGDSLTIDDFFKALAYGLFYKCFDHKVDELPITDITITLVRHTYPREMVKALKKYNFTLTETSPGVYTIEGKNPIPVCLMVTSLMPENEYGDMKLLTKGVKAKDVKNFYDKAIASNDKNIIENAGAVLRICFAANEEVAQEIKEEEFMRKSKLKEIFGDLFEEDIKNAAENAAENATAKATEKANERVATDMLKKNLPLSLIEEISKLSETAILNLAKSLGIAVVM